MEDRFDEVVRPFLLPMEKLEGGPSDTLYFLHEKGGLVYCEGYAHPPGGLYGALIKYPDPRGHINLFGRRFNWTHRRYVDGELQIVPYDEQLSKQVEQLPELASRPPRPPFAECFNHFLLSEFRGFFGNRHSMRIWLETSARMREIIESVEELLDVPRERIGCTGSLSYGFFEEPLEDVDAVFFGSVEQNRRILDRIAELKRREPEREVVELGKSWPLRFTHMGTIICPFFKYSREVEIPLKEFRMTVVREEVVARGVVVDDRHTPYCPSVLTLGGIELDGVAVKDMELVIYDGALRGEYYNGDRLDVKARLVSIEDRRGTRDALLVTRPGCIVKEADA